MDRAFEKLADAFTTKLADRSREACQMRPGGNPKLWSMQEVVEHLVMTYRENIDHLDRYVKRGSPTTKGANWKQFAARIVVLNVGFFPRGMPAPEFVIPGRSGLVGHNGNELGMLFKDGLHLLDDELLRCERMLGPGIIASHFRLGPLSAQQWRKFYVVHGLHHLAQLKRIEWAIGSAGSRLLAEKAEIPGDRAGTLENSIDSRHAQK
jgi:hypothetical protein